MAAHVPVEPLLLRRPRVHALSNEKPELGYYLALYLLNLRK